VFGFVYVEGGPRTERCGPPQGHVVPLSQEPGESVASAKATRSGADPVAGAVVLANVQLVAITRSTSPFTDGRERDIYPWHYLREQAHDR
jgi:hypothetical protein